MLTKLIIQNVNAIAIIRRPLPCISFPRPCEPNSYGVYQYENGCFIWTCVPCPEFSEEDGMLISCLIGPPCKVTDGNGCPQWGCCSNESFPEYIDQ